MVSLVRCIFGPRLHRIHRRSAGASSEESRTYAPNLLESGSDQVIRWMGFCWSLSYYTCPILITFLYRRGYFTADGSFSLVRSLGNLSTVLLISFFLRGVGRYRNDEYMRFLAVLAEAQKQPTVENKKLLGGYDFDFGAWPVDFRWDESEGDRSKPRVQTTPRQAHRSTALAAIPCNVLGYLLAHSFGLSMVYPGSTALIRTLVGPTLQEGRTKLYEEHGGKRAKLLARDGNQIDTMFLDRRQSSTREENGKFLVVCSEGNAGFYEIGCTGTPTEAGFSVLGWNHPGFGGSTGRPFPEQEQNGMDVVLQYAIHQLSFPVENIILFAWSIGGYTASWGAMNYPDLKYVILDATFDDLVPLAVARMPSSWKSLVSSTVRRYINLNIAEQLCHYPGPVLLVRRYRDEMITTEEPAVPRSNRGNDLLLKLLQHRYPKIFDDDVLPVLKQWLSESTANHDHIYSEHRVEESTCQETIRSYVQMNSASFPMLIGSDFDQATKTRYALFLVGRYLREFDSTHCTPLPARFFTAPWWHDHVISHVPQTADDVTPSVGESVSIPQQAE